MPMLPPAAPVLGTQLVHQILLTCLCDPNHFKFGDHARIANLAFITMRQTPPRLDVALFKSVPGMAIAYAQKSRKNTLLSRIYQHYVAHKAPIEFPAMLCHPLDYASRIGSTKLLDSIYQLLPMNRHGVEPGYAATVACELGYLNVLRWWEAKSLPSLKAKRLEFSVPAVALSLAIKNGHLSVVEWWHKWVHDYSMKQAIHFYAMIRIASDARQVPILAWILEQVLHQQQLSPKVQKSIEHAVVNACAHGQLHVLDRVARLASPTGGPQQRRLLPFPLDLRAFDAALQQGQHKVIDWFVARGLPLVFSAKAWDKASRTNPSIAKWWEVDAKWPAKGAHVLSGTAAGVWRGHLSALVFEPRQPSPTIHIRKVTNGGSNVFHSLERLRSHPSYESSSKVAEDAGWLQPSGATQVAGESVTPAELFRVLEVKHMLAAAEAELETIHTRIAAQAVGGTLRPVAEAVNVNFAWHVNGGPFVAPAKYVFGGGYKLKYAGREPVTNAIPDDRLVQFTAKVSLPAIALMPSFSSTLRDQLIHDQFGDELLAYLKNEYQGFQVATPHVKAHVWEQVFSIQQVVKKEPAVKVEAATWDMEPASHAIAAAAEALDD